MKIRNLSYVLLALSFVYLAVEMALDIDIMISRISIAGAFFLIGMNTYYFEKSKSKLFQADNEFMGILEIIMAVPILASAFLPFKLGMISMLIFFILGFVGVIFQTIKWKYLHATANIEVKADFCDKFKDRTMELRKVSNELLKKNSELQKEANKFKKMSGKYLTKLRQRK